MIYVFGYDSNGITHRFIMIFQLDYEMNIPTYFSVLLLMCISVLLLIITTININRKAPYVSRWAILALGFLFMAFDEAFQVHERLSSVGRSLLGNDNLGFFYHSWVIVLILIVFLLFLFFLKFLINLPAKARLSMFIAASIYISGVMGMEMINGAYADIHGEDNLIYSLLTNLEEILEIAGLIVFIWALLTYLADNYKEVKLRFDGFLEKPE